MKANGQRFLLRLDSRGARRLLALLASTWVLAAFAAEGADKGSSSKPDEMVQNVVTQTLQDMRSDKTLAGGNSERTEAYVRKHIITHMDTNRMTALAMGKFWRQVDPQQKQAIADEFTTLLIRTYSQSLMLYKNYDISFLPLRMNPDESEVQVQTYARQEGKPQVQMDYRLVKDNNEWKVYDIAVGGVSLVTNFRSMFTAMVRDKGMEGLLEALREKSRSARRT